MKSKAQVVEAYRRETIRDAAVRAIARKGFDQITMHDVAAEAGVSKATLYLYFRNAEEIRRAAGERVQELLLGEIDRAVEAGGTPEDTLMRVIRRALELLDDRDDAILAALDLARQSRLQFEARIFDLLRERGLPNLGSLPRMWFVLDCLRGTLERRLRDDAERPRERIAALTAAMLLHGMSSVHAVDWSAVDLRLPLP